MIFNDLPKIKPRRWHRMASAYGGYPNKAKAKAMAQFMRSRSDVAEVKLVKTTRWVLFWKFRSAPPAKETRK